jgi:hypothetical protein
MNPTPTFNDDSRKSETPSPQTNEPAKVDPIQETVMLSSKDGSSHSASSHIDDWRELARRIQEESDSSKLVNLVQQLIAKFDEQNSRGL